MDADIDVSEPKPPVDQDAPLTFTMEGHTVGPRQPAALLPFVWAPRWNSVQAVKKFQEEIDGPLIGGDAGVRLIEPSTLAGDRAFFRELPAAFAPAAGSWLIVPLHHIFGGEELSAHSAPLAERIPAPYLALNPADAGVLGAEPDQYVTVTLHGCRYRLPVRHDPNLVPGTAGIPAGLPGKTPATLPERMDAPEVTA